MVVGELSVTGRPTNLDSRARTYCTCSRCVLGLFLSFLFSGRWPDIDRKRSQRAVKPKTTNQPINVPKILTGYSPSFCLTTNAQLDPKFLQPYTEG